MRRIWVQVAVAGTVVGICLPFTQAQRKVPAASKTKTHPAPIERAPALTPLTPRERAEQLLDRFTYGPRPGEIDRVVAEGGVNWLEQQLNPGVIPDSVFGRRLADYPAIGMSPQQALTVFPDRQQVKAAADGRDPMPSDALRGLETSSKIAAARDDSAEAR